MDSTPSIADQLGLGVDPTFAWIVLGGVVGVLILIWLLSWMLSKWLVVCRPNEILLLTGRRHRLEDGTLVGYKVINGGRAFKFPVLETIARMDIRLIPIEIEVKGAYSRGGIPLFVQAIANVKIAASRDEHVRNAVERFLGSTTDQIALVAQQTLEGVLREVVAQLTPEEVNEDRLKFAATLVQHAQDDFEKLGLELDILKVQHVSDDQQYLQNLGRARIATMLRDAQNADNAANQTIAEEQAGASQRAELATKNAEIQVLQLKNQMRTELATLEAQVKACENEAKVAAETARAMAEQELQAKRSDLEKLRLECDVVLPASAKRAAQEARSRGLAAPVMERGKATATALAAISTEWQAAGKDGRDIFLLQQLSSFAEAAVARVTKSSIKDLQVVDDGTGDAYTTTVAAFPAAVARVMMETGHAMGLDISSLLGKKGGA
jgi:flotillin